MKNPPAERASRPRRAQPPPTSPRPHEPAPAAVVGYVDHVDSVAVTGWVLDPVRPNEPLAVDILADGVVVAQGRADLFRPDVAAAGFQSIVGGFVVKLPPEVAKDHKVAITAREPQSGVRLNGGAVLYPLAQRCRCCIDGFVSPTELAGWLVDQGNPQAVYTVQLFEGNLLVASARTDLPHERGGHGRFLLRPPQDLLDGEVHALRFHVAELAWDIGTWRYVTPRAAPGAMGAPPPKFAPLWLDLLPGEVLRRKNSLPVHAPRPDTVALEESLAKLEVGDDERRAALHVEFGMRAVDAGQSAQALEHLRKAVLLNPVANELLARGLDRLAAAGLEAQADQLLDQRLASVPDDAEALVARDRIRASRRGKTSRLIAFYLPQFHPTPENDLWWGKGFTEWTNVAAAAPLFDGHVQPRRPTALGYYDLRLPEAVNAQFELARQYGVDAFCYYYYSFRGRRVLPRPLQDLVEGRTGPFPFCICWANEDWTRSWDGHTGEVLMAQDHSLASDNRFIAEVGDLLAHPDYVRLDGKPVLLVYRADKLAAPRKTVAAWRKWCRENGIGEIHLCAVQSFGFDDPRPLGFDSAAEFPPHSMWHKYKDIEWYENLIDPPGIVDGFEGNISEYPVFSAAFMARRREPYVLHRGVMLGWDNTARKGKSAHVFHDFSVDQYRTWLTHSIGRNMRENGDALTFVNAWNEWAEGAVLEPDFHFGYGPLEATRRAKALGYYSSCDTYWRRGLPEFTFDRINATERVILVGHDAFRAGSQLNLLNMARSLKRQLAVEVVVFLRQGGELLAEFQKIGPTYVLGDQEDGDAFLRERLRFFRKQGVEKAICNGATTGDLIPSLKAEGLRVASLIHELPGMVKEHHLEAGCWHAAGHADSLVFASRVVSDSFADRYWPDPRKICISPQGIAFNRYLAQRDALRLELRRSLDLPDAALLVLGCGHADIRKGADLFVRMAADVAKSLPPRAVAFVWIGDLHLWLEPHVRADIERLGLKDMVRFTGKVDDAARFFAAGDIFALTSREDPFPSVVMEAFDAGLPVVAFDGGGGYVDIVGEATGALVAPLDTAAMAAAITGLLGDAPRRQAIGRHVHALCRSSFGYPRYLRQLLALLDGVAPRDVEAGLLTRQPWPPGQPRPRISAIVPNCNYARFLELRLRTVADQTLPPDEIIVLDDASQDDSLEVVAAFRQRCSIPVRVVRNKRRSGNPFAQWAKGLALAKGDLVWIAEADDYCEPTLLESLAGQMLDPGVVLAWSDSTMVDATGRLAGGEYKHYFAGQLGDWWLADFTVDGRELIERCLGAHNVVPNASAALFRRSAVAPDVLAQIGRYAFSGDWWFWLALARQGRVAYRAEALNYHRRHGASVMGQVLRDPGQLIEETIGFFTRLAGTHPDVLSAAVRVQMVERIQGLYRSLQREAAAPAVPALRDHPQLGAPYVALRALLQPERAMQEATRPQHAHLVLGQDVLVEAADVATGLIRRLAAHGEVTVVLLDCGNPATLLPADVARWCEQVLLVAPGDDVGAALQGASLVITHGLEAHGCVARLSEHLACPWQVLAGAEFDKLLGEPFEGAFAGLADIRHAVERCTGIRCLVDVVPHALGRLARIARRPVDRLAHWQATGLSATPEAYTVVAVRKEATPQQWAEFGASLHRLGQACAERWLLRLIDWGPATAGADAGQREADVVRLFEAPADWSSIGDVLVSDETPAGWLELHARVRRSRLLEQLPGLLRSQPHETTA